jgi:hypothetical protein
VSGRATFISYIQNNWDRKGSAEKEGTRQTMSLCIAGKRQNGTSQICLGHRNASTLPGRGPYIHPHYMVEDLQYRTLSLHCLGRESAFAPPVTGEHALECPDRTLHPHYALPGKDSSMYFVVILQKDSALPETGQYLCGRGQHFTSIRDSNIL